MEWSDNKLYLNKVEKIDQFFLHTYNFASNLHGAMFF